MAMLASKKLLWLQQLSGFGAGSENKILQVSFHLAIAALLKVRLSVGKQKENVVITSTTRFCLRALLALI